MIAISHRSAASPLARHAAGRVEVPVGRLSSLLVGITLAVTALGLAAALAAQLSFASVLLQEGQESFVRLLSLDLEANLPTWYSTTLLLSGALLSAVIAATLEREARTRGRWLLLALLFLVLSLDEAAILHEMAIKPMRQVFETSGYLYYGWVIPGGALVIAVTLYYWRFVFALPKPVRLRFVLAAALFVLGALGVEAVTGRIEEQQGRVLTYQLLAVLEEALEMLGVVVGIQGLLIYLRDQVGRFEVRIVDDRHGRPS